MLIVPANNLFVLIVPVLHISKELIEPVLIGPKAKIVLANVAAPTFENIPEFAKYVSSPPIMITLL